MSIKVYEWILCSKQKIIRQGILCADSKKKAKEYLIKSLNEDEKTILNSCTMTITLLKL